jgi:predicted acyl esterase
MRRSQVAATCAAIGAACASLAIAPNAHAIITSVFTRSATPIPCSAQPNGVRLCDETAFSPVRARSTIRTFDGVPIDVRVAFPPAPASGPDGPYPLITMFHGYGGSKFRLLNMQPWLTAGYAVFSMTERGFGESCGTVSARAAEPVACSSGYIRLMDTRYEVRDAQELVGLLADDGRISPRQIGATGASYGGAKSLALAALKDRKMLPDGTLAPWTSPDGLRMSIAAAVPKIGWTDLAYSLFPNGGTLDYVADAPYRGRTGVLKKSWENALYATGSAYFYPPPGADPTADPTAWHIELDGGEPYDDSGGDPLAAFAALRDQATTYRSSYYIDHSQAPAPLLISNGWTDDLFPADEAIRFYNRTRTLHPFSPISLFLLSFGHQRGQAKFADGLLLNARMRDWMDYYVRGAGSPPFQGIEALTQTCPDSAASGGPYFAGNWNVIAPGEIRIEDSSVIKIKPSADPPAGSTTFDPLVGGGACATAAASDTAAATYRSAPVPAGGFTLMGSPTVVAEFSSRGANSQVAARLFDVDPGTQQETLVARGLWRTAISNGYEQQVFQLHPNGYRFAPGHVFKLELLPNDSPYGRVSNGQADVRVANLQLRLPVLEPPGALDGLVESPAPKVVPAGYSLARDFAPATYPQPRVASPVQVALVPVFSQCTSPNRQHGSPLAFGSCRPPLQLSPQLTFGTREANGEAPNFVGSAGYGVVGDDPLTPASEADVALSVSLTDVRRGNGLADYAGELESRTSLQITDRSSGGTLDEAATVQSLALHAAVPCAPTAAADTGADCAVLTSANTLVPGTVLVGSRAIWELGDVEVLDGGADGAAATTADNTLLARQGLFVP